MEGLLGAGGAKRNGETPRLEQRQGAFKILSGSSPGAMKTAVYDSSLTDAQWALLQPMLPKPKRRGRPPTDRRRILEEILYMVKGGLQWGERV